MQLAGRSALVTGAGSGFGAAIARLFAARGARVGVMDLNGEAVGAVAGEIAAAGGVALPLVADVTDGAAVGRALAQVAAAWGGLDVLVNNAGIAQRPAGIARLPEAEIDRLFAVNVKGIYHTAVHALPMLRGREDPSIVNVASTAGLRPRPGMAWYNATKAAVVSLTYTMATELARDRIRVNAIAPALAATPMKDMILGGSAEGEAAVIRTIPLGRLAAPEDIAEAALYLASPGARFVTGIVLPVDGGRTAA